MSISLPHYATIKNRYCICYLGSCNEYILQLLYLRSAIEKELPGIELWIAHKNEVSYLVKDYNKTISITKLQNNKRNFAYIRNLKCNMRDHPIMELIEESEILLSSLVVPKSPRTTKCIICPKGFLPTRSMSPKIIEKIISHCVVKGYDVEIGTDIEGAGWVVGVENEQLFLAAFRGIKTSLIPTGIGTDFYKKLFSQGEILEV